MVGLNSDQAADYGYTGIDFAWYPAAGGVLQIYESGSLVENFSGTYTTSEVFSITYDGRHVRYWRGTLCVRSTYAPRLSLGLDTSFFAAGSINSLGFGPMAETTNAYTLQKQGLAIVETPTQVSKAPVGSFAWDSGSFSLEGYTGGAFVTFRAGETNTAKMAGLNSDPGTDASFASLDHAIYLQATGIVAIYENGSPVAAYGAYDTDDIFTVRYDGWNVRYFQNAQLLHSVAVGADKVFHFDSSLYDPGASIVAVSFAANGQVSGIVTGQINPNEMTEIFKGTKAAQSLTSLLVTPVISLDIPAYPFASELVCTAVGSSQHTCTTPGTVVTRAKILQDTEENFGFPILDGAYFRRSDFSASGESWEGFSMERSIVLPANTARRVSFFGEGQFGPGSSASMSNIFFKVEVIKR
jgi:hypothetical protein